MSTLPYYAKANIGSRPSKRGKSDTFKFEDLRAIPFVGSWSQKTKCSRVFGLGISLKTIIDKGKLDELKKLFKSSKFFEL